MRAYSLDLRERVVRAVAEGQPMSVAARRFAVSTITVKRLVQLQQQTGSLQRRPIVGAYGNWGQSTMPFYALGCKPRRMRPCLSLCVVGRVARAIAQ